MIISITEPIFPIILNWSENSWQWDKWQVIERDTRHKLRTIIPDLCAEHFTVLDDKHSPLDPQVPGLQVTSDTPKMTAGFLCLKNRWLSLRDISQIQTRNSHLDNWSNVHHIMWSLFQEWFGWIYLYLPKTSTLLYTPAPTGTTT